MDKKLLLEKIEDARRDLGSAEVDLEKVLREILVAPRADKKTISKVVKDAFSKLKAARVTLGELQKLVSRDSG